MIALPPGWLAYIADKSEVGILKGKIWQHSICYLSPLHWLAL